MYLRQRFGRWLCLFRRYCADCRARVYSWDTCCPCCGSVDFKGPEIELPTDWRLQSMLLAVALMLGFGIGMGVVALVGDLVTQIISLWYQSVSFVSALISLLPGLLLLLAVIALGICRIVPERHRQWVGQLITALFSFLRWLSSLFLKRKTEKKKKGKKKKK